MGVAEEIMNLENAVPAVQSWRRVQLFETPWTVACQTLLSMGFSRQEYWSGLPFPSLGDLPDLTQGSPALQAVSCITGGFSTNWSRREALFLWESLFFFGAAPVIALLFKIFAHFKLSFSFYYWFVRVLIRGSLFKFYFNVIRTLNTRPALLTLFWCTIECRWL